jgi:hypothetical protein
MSETIQESADEIIKLLIEAANNLNGLPAVDQKSKLRDGTPTVEMPGTPSHRDAYSLGIDVNLRPTADLSPCLTRNNLVYSTHPKDRRSSSSEG